MLLLNYKGNDKQKISDIRFGKDSILLIEKYCLNYLIWSLFEKNFKNSIYSLYFLKTKIKSNYDLEIILKHIQLTGSRKV